MACHRTVSGLPRDVEEAALGRGPPIRPCRVARLLVSQKPPRFTSAPAKPCDACPAKTWGAFHDPTNIEAERQIRADQRRLDMRELDATAKDLAYLLDQLGLPEKPKDIDVVKTFDALSRIRTHVSRLIATAERRAA